MAAPKGGGQGQELCEEYDLNNRLQLNVEINKTLSTPRPDNPELRR